MKIKLYQRQVYYKVGMIEIEIPDLEDSDYTEAHEYLINHEGLWANKLEDNMDKYPLKHGFGMDDLIDWTDHTEESEYMYKLPNGNGGHI
jgi:hypothetical protein